jgi:hypothetical protein
MVRHLTIVALEFRVAGLVFAVPALATLAVVADAAFSLRRLPPLDNSEPLDIGTYGFIAIMANVARGLGPILHAIAGAAAWVVALLVIAASLALVLAVLLYLTGRGIGHHAAWARIFGGLLSFGLALVSCLAMTSLPRDLAPLAAAPLGLSLYTLWVLIWRFA